MEKKKLGSMISESAYNEIEVKAKSLFGKAFPFLFPAVVKALEEGDGEVREEILINLFNADSMRVCSYCGEIMEEGWYLGFQGYACSDSCCMHLMGIDKEEFDRYGIYLNEITEYLNSEGKGRKPEDLSKDEIDEISTSIVDDLDAYYYTEWY